MENGRNDRQSLLQREQMQHDSSGAVNSTSTLKFEQLGADDVLLARQLQLQHPQQPLKKCEFCRKPVLPQKEVPSCRSSEGVVHAGCADAERRFEDKREESVRAATANRSVEEQHECIICQSVRFRRREGAAPGVILRDDQRWIKPCFCEVYAHHGCLAGVVAQRRTCPQCGVQYSFRVYGSLLDFLSRYWLSYCFIITIVTFFCFIAVYAIVHVAVYPVSSWPSGRVVLLIVGLFLTGTALCCLGSCLRYTFGFRVPRFKSKYSFVRVSSYAPPESRVGKTSSLLMKQVPRKSSGKSRNLLSFSLPSDDSVVLHPAEHTNDFQYTSTPKIAGSSIPLDFATPSFRQHLSPKSFRKLEEHPLRLTLERVLELPEEDSISYDDTSKEIQS
ncbi:hypothetical protein PFISCL1PPCAC_8345 [Pristionchus fissidentatus]|uniref:RING-CH-type domain-containing protein n=1 Tax=Pristionchus fissidentatus TaxID=1538716 RepID=A0AAV5VFP5_9BILA|nr:hypothetical protein PFISCL1PPCAC_8345 [Pristionchus fissidentatus]